MPIKKKTTVYRMNLVTVGIGQGQMETLPYLYNETEYTPGGAVLSQSVWSSGGLLVEKMVFNYDPAGRLAAQLYFTEPDEPSEQVTFERDEKGVVLKDVRKYLDGSTDTTVYSYDDQGQLKDKITRDDEGIIDLAEQFSWNGKYLLKHETRDGEGNIVSLEEFRYDEKGNVVEHFQTDEETGENRKTVTAYDAEGRKTGEEVYSEEGDLLEKSTYVLDESGRVVSSEYDSAQKWSTTEYQYDERGNNLGHLETDDEGNQLLSVEHTYDEQNNRLESVIFSNGGTLATNQHYKLKFEYEWYDE
jgi:antitoxin component YwqK of YwqJK toxin-antitoxin module